MNTSLKDHVGLLQEDERDESATKDILVCFVFFALTDVLLSDSQSALKLRLQKQSGRVCVPLLEWLSQKQAAPQAPDTPLSSASLPYPQV